MNKAKANADDKPLKMNNNPEHQHKAKPSGHTSYFKSYLT